VTHTVAELAGFKAQILRRRWITSLAFLLITFPLYGLLFSRRRGAVFGIGPGGWVAVWVALAVGIALLCFRLWRCPACGGWLGQLSTITVCPGCGVRLR